jgi:phage repressor protein C with HTH and peptisase S24 domain
MEKLENWHQRLAYALTKRDKSKAELARAAKVTPVSVGDWISGKTKMIGGKNAVVTCEFLRINHNWLFSGKGPSGLDNDYIEKAEIDLDDDPDFVQVRRAELKISAGISGFSIEYLNGERAPIIFRKDWLQRRGYFVDDLIAIEVCGNSMEPTLYDGDLVVINIAEKNPTDGDVFAANYEGELVIKRMSRDLGAWWLTSDNLDKRRYPNKKCDEQCFVLGKVVHRQSERI